MTVRGLTVEFSPTTGPFETPVWVSLSEGGPHGNRVLSAEWVDGKQSDLSEFPAGEATIVLTNDDRLFDPEFQGEYVDEYLGEYGGIYAGLLSPRVPFRIRYEDEDGDEYGDEYESGYGGSADLFYGFVEDGWEQNYQPPEGATCTVKLVDLIAVIQGYTLPSVLGAAIAALDPVGYWPLTESAGAGSVSDRVGSNDADNVGETTLGANPIAPGLGTSAQFDGLDDRFDISRSWLWDRTNLEWTIVAVIRTDVEAEYPTSHPIFMQVAGNASADIDALFVNWDGFIERYRYRGGGGTTYEHPTYVADGEPHIIFAQALVDFGIAVDDVTMDTTTGTGFTQSGNGVAIGGTPFAARLYTDYQFEGRIGHVAVWDVGLDSTQRQTILDGYGGLDGARSDEQIAWALDQIGVPATMRDLDVGASIMGAVDAEGRDALAFIREVAATEQGGFYVAHHDGGKLKFRQRYASFQDTRSIVSQAAFTDDPAAVGTYARVEPGTLQVEPNGIKTVINQATVTWRGGQEIVDESAGSPYGPHGVTIDTQATSPNIARGLGQWVVALNSTPAARIRSLGINPGASADEFPIALGTRIGDRVSYRSHPQQVGSATTKELEVQGRSHRVAGRQWQTLYYLTNAISADVDLFTLGTSELGGTHVLAY